MQIYIFIGLLFLTFGLWILALVDITRSKFKNSTMNTVWLLIIIFFPFIGSIIYFLLRNKFTTTERRKFQPDFNRNS